MKKKSRHLPGICLLVILIILGINTPKLTKQVRQEEAASINYQGPVTNDKICLVPKENFDKLLADNMATTIIFLNNKNHALNQTFYDFVKASNGQTGLNRKIYIFSTLYHNAFVDQLDLDQGNVINVLFFEGKQVTKTYQITPKTDLSADFVDKINTLALGVSADEK